MIDDLARAFLDHRWLMFSHYHRVSIGAVSVIRTATARLSRAPLAFIDAADALYFMSPLFELAAIIERR